MELMAEAGRISALALRAAGEAVAPGASTAKLDEIAEKVIRSHDAIPAFKGYGGFPATICASINDELVHGIPRHDRILEEGDIITIDVGAVYKGYVGDNADTFAVGEIDSESQRLIDVTRQGLHAGIKQCVEGNRLGDVCAAIGAVAAREKLGNVTAYTGHGIGVKMHEPPNIPNMGTRGTGARLKTGMTFALEPMFTLGQGRVHVLDDDWTVVTSDGSRCAQIEHTVAITKGGPVILTTSAPEST
jgi:methionyl aminopeptidase